MKYRVILEVIFNDGTDDKVGIYSYDTEDLALKGFYQYMGQYVGSDKVASVNVICKNSVGVIYKDEVWQNTNAPIVEPVIEPTESVEN